MWWMATRKVLRTPITTTFSVPQIEGRGDEFRCLSARRVPVQRVWSQLVCPLGGGWGREVAC